MKKPLRPQNMTDDEIMNGISTDTEVMYNMFVEIIGSDDRKKTMVLSSMQSSLAILYTK